MGIILPISIMAKSGGKLGTGEHRLSSFQRHYGRTLGLQKQWQRRTSGGTMHESGKLLRGLITLYRAAEGGRRLLQATFALE